MASDADAKGNSREAAVGDKRRREWESVRVLDGASAPKHTGIHRHDGRAAGSASTVSSASVGGARTQGLDLSDPAALGAVTLALSLLHARLKAEATSRGAKRQGTMDRRSPGVVAMADPFVSLLTR